MTENGPVNICDMTKVTSRARRAVSAAAAAAAGNATPG